jgi:hypothetical protein
LARPVFCSRIMGPIERVIRANKLAVLVGSKWRAARSIPIVNAPTAAWPRGLVTSRSWSLVRIATTTLAYNFGFHGLQRASSCHRYAMRSKTPTSCAGRASRVRLQRRMNRAGSIECFARNNERTQAWGAVQSRHQLRSRLRREQPKRYFGARVLASSQARHSCPAQGLSNLPWDRGVSAAYCGHDGR